MTPQKHNAPSPHRQCNNTLEHRPDACHSRAMKIYGIDFTSAPSRKKPITCLECELDGSQLSAETQMERSDL